MLPRESDHKAKAERNEKFAASLDVANPVHENWAVVATFYAALHYVEAFLVRGSGVRSVNHDDRNNRIKAHPRLRTAWPHYSWLHENSTLARYHCVGLPKDAYAKQAAPHLEVVRKSIENIIGIDGQAAVATTGGSGRFLIEKELPRPVPGKPKDD